MIMRKFNWKKSVAIALSTVCMVGALAGCGSSSSDNGNDSAKAEKLNGSITAAGSSALKPLVDDAADLFNEKYPDVNITIDAGGSGEGLKQVSEGTVNIGNSDVEAAEKLDATKASALEKGKADESTKVTMALVDHKVCVVTAIVNKVLASGVKNLTKAQLTDIFTGKITNWKEVGGADEAIVLITRPESSGTRATFKKYALDGASEASNKSMETDDSGVLLQNVKTTRGHNRICNLSYLVSNPGVDTVSIDGVEPTLENTYAGKYPVWTYEHMYTKGNADEVSQKFLDYIMSGEYGKKMEALGYGVSSKMTVKEH